MIRSKNFPGFHIGAGEDDLSTKITEDNVQKFYIRNPGLTEEKGTVSFEAVDKPNHFLRHFNNLLDLEAVDGARNPEKFDDDATFYLRDSKFFPGFYSFESVNFPEHFIRHQGYRLKISSLEKTELYQNDASFKAYDGLPGGSVGQWVSGSAG